MFSLTIQDQNDQIITQVTFEQGSYVLGRLESCDIVLPSSSVSRKHARIFVHNGRCYLEDLGSANGIIVDGQRVVGRRDLGTASQIRIGDFYLFLEFNRPGLDADQRVLQTVFIPRDSDHFKLVRIFDSFAGEEFVLSESENTIGRTDENFILLSDPSISRHHAKIVREGDTYSVFDLNSSNGTSVNGRDLKAPKTLTSRDQIKFGNVEFLFVEGDAQIDLSQYVTPPDRGSKFLRIAGSAVLVLSGIALGGTLLYSVLNFKNGPPDEDQEPPKAVVTQPTETLEDKVDDLVDKGDQAAERGEWSLAIAAYKEALEMSPDHERARELLEQAERERAARARLERGEEFSERGEHEEALELLTQIREGTRAHERAKSTIGHLQRTLAHNYKNEALRLQRQGRRSWKPAHDKLVRALELTPEDEEALTQLEKLERRMKRAGITFEAYSPEP